MNATTAQATTAGHRTFPVTLARVAGTWEDDGGEYSADVACYTEKAIADRVHAMVFEYSNVHVTRPATATTPATVTYYRWDRHTQTVVEYDAYAE